MIREIKKSLAELGLNENEIRTYVSLTMLGEAPASQIAKKANLPRTTAISILNKLAEDNYLTFHRHRGITYYWVESPQAIVGQMETKIRIAKNLNTLLGDLYRKESHFPKAKVFDTKKAIRNFMEKVLTDLPRKSTIYTIDTPHMGNYQKIFSEKIGDTIRSHKITREILTKTLIPYDTFKTISKRKFDIPIEIKELPQEINFQASLWLVDDMLVHFSGNPPFVVAVKHQLICQSMHSIYQYLWQISTPKN